MLGDAQSALLEQLRFKDIYMRFPPGPDPFKAGPPVVCYKPKPKMGEPAPKGVHPIPTEFRSASDELVALTLKSFAEKNKANFSFRATNNLRIRAVSYSDQLGQWRTALRSIDKDVHNIDELNIRESVLATLKRWVTKKAGIYIFGATGEGKSTTCTSLINYFLSHHGGYLYAAENPVEFEFSPNNYDNAEICQREIDTDEQWQPVMEDALRSNPDCLYASEFRNAACIKMLIRGSTSGHLTISTGHAFSVQDGLMFMAQATTQNADVTARIQLAQGLVGAAHQTLVNGRPHITLLENTPAVSSLLREGQYHLLENELQTQKTALARSEGEDPTYGSKTVVAVPPNYSKQMTSQESRPDSDHDEAGDAGDGSEREAVRRSNGGRRVKRRIPPPPPTFVDKIRAWFSF
ncbi:twitching motility protein [Acetobacter malorum DSM 14337]|uniref:Twitching motility protein n=1 Tax=Acetobacter malorum DSM 14337 TaxID=1307910 RepID=A0ABQ0Q0G0_9PROT|nr:ATPase, T2SS/T4P/T4SS family [Acetobacter malorum]KXV09865.1 hypothetical protein AD930_02235 [Acetobacter malorum]GBQ86089.1 twitching motility protein [Acetobacter malorum DSM 14337]